MTRAAVPPSRNTFAHETRQISDANSHRACRCLLPISIAAYAPFEGGVFTPPRGQDRHTSRTTRWIPLRFLGRDDWTVSLPAYVPDASHEIVERHFVRSPRGFALSPPRLLERVRRARLRGLESPPERVRRGQRHRPEDIRRRHDSDRPPLQICLLYTSPSPRDVEESRMPSSA